MDPVVRLRAAVTLLGRFPALAGVDLDVAAGEVVLVRGPNGAGKTTLLRLCAGLLPLASGEGRVLGHDLAADRRELRGRVGLLGHASALYDDLTVRDNLRFWARASPASPSRGWRGSRRARRDAVERAEAAARRFGVAGRLADLPVARLSAGQRRRADLAVLAAREPEVWLLDEPHAGLDAAGRDGLDGVVRDAAAAGAAVVLASHDHERGAALADREVVLGGGCVTEERSAGDRRRPDGAATAPATDPERHRAREPGVVA